MSCDCPESNPYAADAAFVGTVVDEWRPRLVPFIRERQLTVEVDEVLTGEVPAVVRFTYRQGLCRSGIPVGPMLTFYVSDRLGDTPEITLGCVPVAPEEARALRDTTMQEPWGDPIAEALFTLQREPAAVVAVDGRGRVAGYGYGDRVDLLAPCPGGAVALTATHVGGVSRIDRLDVPTLTRTPIGQAENVRTLACDDPAGGGAAFGQRQRATGNEDDPWEWLPLAVDIRDGSVTSRVVDDLVASTALDGRRLDAIAGPSGARLVWSDGEVLFDRFAGRQVGHVVAAPDAGVLLALAEGSTAIVVSADGEGWSEADLPLEAAGEPLGVAGGWTLPATSWDGLASPLLITHDGRVERGPDDLNAYEVPLSAGTLVSSESSLRFDGPEGGRIRGDGWSLWDNHVAWLGSPVPLDPAATRDLVHPAVAAGEPLPGIALASEEPRTGMHPADVYALVVIGTPVAVSLGLFWFARRSRAARDPSAR